MNVHCGDRCTSSDMYFAADTMRILSLVNKIQKEQLF